MSPLTRALAVLALAALLPAQAPKLRPAPPNAPARLRQLTPKQRQMLLESLPPNRRKQAADRLDRFDSLSPAEQKQLEQRWEHFQQMSPANREKARILFRSFNALPDDRREALLPEFEKLRSLAPGERTAHLGGSEVRSRYSRKELEILNRYAELAPPPM